MSLIKRYAEDMADLTYRGTLAAWEPTADKRRAALDVVFQDCGTAARIYADPGHAAKTFVSAVVRAFMDARKSKTYQHAG